ncbi:hypothetical protein K8089_02120 [Aequorivita sp. F47161]|uniref:Uncharacterized protein n=1 Tax=Aequorivita vitellina TaxID=2874475 RepID=A0A9X1U8U3_9FLAO|nr:hypothetical protein [Aequorivita vitellina]MCG2417801.1 hypothetical protein [Aequorivita vitellina]
MYFQFLKAFIDIYSTYTNLEFEFTDDEFVTVEAVMQMEGWAENEVESY